MSSFANLLAICLPLAAPALALEDLGDRWGTAHRERAYYPIVNVPMPQGEVIEAGAFCVLPDGRIAVGTRRGDIWFLDDVDSEKPEPTYHRFATGLDEIFGLAWRDGSMYVTQSCELTRVTDTDGDLRADRFDVVSDAWGYANYHEYAFGSKFDPEGNQYVALGLSQSYNSRALFRGWALKVTPEGETIPLASGMRSPGGIGFNEHGALVYMESQGPWNSSCSLKAIRPGSFLGHPASFNWYPFAPNMGPAPLQPEPRTRIVTERERVPELVPYSVIFPYIRMGRSISGFTVDRTAGGFGPFQDQMFLGDFSLSVVLRATMEEVKGVWQGACYPFREGLSTGLLNVAFTPGGNLLCGGTNRGWPVRGIQPFALERLSWTGVMPFEIERIEIAPRGFEVSFTKPVDEESGSDPTNYVMGTFTHVYKPGYGGPEVDQTKPVVRSVQLSQDRRKASLTVDGMVRGHVHEFDLAAVRSADGEELLHRDAYYTVNEIPDAATEGPRWLTYSGGDGPGQGKHVVLVAADQEYRSEQAMPMLARLLSERHGYDCTVLFAQNADGLVDPTMKIKWQDENVVHSIPGLEHLEQADLLILFSRLVTLPEDQRKHIHTYLDSGKPIVAFRTANHGFIGLDYKLNGENVKFGDDVLGGAFRGHHGRWHQDSTLATPVDEHREHPILRGIESVWGPSDVYRTYPEGESLPADCTPLLMGQPLMNRTQGSGPNLDLIPLPVAWVKTWVGASGKPARVFHSTMGSGRDFQDEGMRRLAVNASYWCLGIESEIDPEGNVDVVGDYAPLPSGFNYEKLGVRPMPLEEYR